MIAQTFLPEFDREMATTRRVLERVPQDQLDWRPHEKSFRMGELAGHLANVLDWVPPTMSLEMMDIEPNGVPWKQPSGPVSVVELLTKFDDNRDKARAILAEATDETYMAPWSLAKNTKVVMTMPRVAVIRSFILNHMIHHRGQLSVYLRLAGAEVPSIYGPSADDPGAM
jgi:uncharacterized damage-inducible protein DinB